MKDLGEHKAANAFNLQVYILRTGYSAHRDFFILLFLSITSSHSLRLNFDLSVSCILLISPWYLDKQ